MTKTPKLKQPTHRITFWNEKLGWVKETQRAYGKNDLFAWLRQMVRNGYTEFKIETLETKSK